MNGSLARKKPTSEIRLEITADPASELVDTRTFLSLITSRRSLTRIDFHVARLRGLLDTATGERFLIEEEKLG